MTQQAYTLALRSLYLQLPNTHHRFSRSDRHLASILYQRGFSLDLVRSALLLATARRLAHDPAHPLPPVRSLSLLLTCLRRNQAPAASAWLPAIPGTQNQLIERANDPALRNGSPPNRRVIKKPRFLMRANTWTCVPALCLLEGA